MAIEEDLWILSSSSEDEEDGLIKPPSPRPTVAEIIARESKLTIINPVALDNDVAGLQISLETLMFNMQENIKGVQGAINAPSDDTMVKFDSPFLMPTHARAPENKVKQVLGVDDSSTSNCMQSELDSNVLGFLDEEQGVLEIMSFPSETEESSEAKNVDRQSPSGTDALPEEEEENENADICHREDEAKNIDRQSPSSTDTPTEEVNIYVCDRGDEAENIDRQSSSSTDTLPNNSRVVASTRRVLTKRLLRACRGITRSISSGITAAKVTPSESISALLQAGALVDCSDLGKTPLHLALSCLQGRERVDAVASLLAAGASVHGQDASGATPMHAVASSSAAAVASREQGEGGAAELAAMLLGAAEGNEDEASSVLDLVNARNNRGLTPLLVAVSATADAPAGNAGEERRPRGSPSSGGSVGGLVSLLLSRGADPWLSDGKYGRSALHSATLSARASVVAELLQERQGARILQERVDSVTSLGCTALHLAAQRGLHDIAAMLLDAGASTTPRAVGGGSAGETPVETAHRLRHFKLHRLLLQASPKSTASEDGVHFGSFARQIIAASTAAQLPPPPTKATMAAARWSAGREGPSADKLSEWRNGKASQLEQAARRRTKRVAAPAAPRDATFKPTLGFHPSSQSVAPPSVLPPSPPRKAVKAVDVVPPGRDLEPHTAQPRKRQRQKGLSRQESRHWKTDPLIQRENERIAERLGAIYTRPLASSTPPQVGSISQHGEKERHAAAAVSAYAQRATTKGDPSVRDGKASVQDAPIPKTLGSVRCAVCGTHSGNLDAGGSLRVPFRTCHLCDQAWYCDDTCRRVDWALAHRRQCDGVRLKTKTLRGAPTTAMNVHTSYWVQDERYRTARHLLRQRPKPSEAEVLHACATARAVEAKTARAARQGREKVLSEPGTAAKLPSKAAQHSMRRLRVEGPPRHADDRAWRSKKEEQVEHRALYEGVMPYVADEFDVITGKIKQSQRHDLERRIDRAREVVQDVPEERPLVERMWSRDMARNSERRVVFGGEPGRARSVFSDIGEHGVPYQDDAIYTGGVRKDRIDIELPGVLFDG